MKPQKKAEELVNRYYHLFSVELENTINYREAKECALIAVDEIVKSHPYGLSPELKNYWQEVKNEIKNL